MAEETKDESLEEGKAASNLNLKGIDTVTGSAEELIEKEKLSPIIDDGNGDDDKKKKKRKKKKLSNPLFRSADLYQQPTTEKEKFLADLSSAASSPASPEVLGTDFTFDKDAFDFLKAQFTPIDLSNGIPDPIEREAFKEEHKNKIVQLLDPNKIGIRFENQLEDLATFRKLAYDKNLKKFLDDLDENQAWYETTFNNLIKLPLDIALGVGSLIPLAYGMGKALFNGDSKYIFDNGGFDLLEDTQHYIDKKFVVYGGADYTQGDKNFFARFKDNPGKMLNQDVIPLLGFVGSAVATELVAGALAVPTGGASLLAGGARFTARAQQLFSKSVNVVRGLDVLDDVNKMNKIANLTTKWRRGYGTAIQMMRSSGYESSLIARDTEKNTKELSKLNYINANPKLRTQYENLIRQNSDPFGNLLISHEAILDQVSIPKNILKRIDFNAAQASRLAYWSNVPLVGFSNLIQFSKTFNTSYRLGQKITGQGAKLNPLRGVKYAKDTATGKVTAFAAADKAGKIKKVLGWGMVAGKGFATEAFEEFSQGVFEKGYSDYYSAPFTNKSLRRTKDFFSTMTNSARNYYNSVEGQDSIWLGGLAGMFGIPLYGKIDTKTGKLQRGWQWYGGAYQEIKEVKERIEKDRKRAKQYNETPINPIAKNNFENYIREQQFQDEMDQAQKEGNKHEYQNAKYKSTHAFVTNRIKNGIENTIFQDLDSLDKMDLKTFNDNYGWKGFEFTAEQKKDAIEDTRSVVKNIIEAHKKTENLFADRRIWIDKFFDKHYKGIEDPFYLLEGVKDQMAFLLGSIGDYKKREKELSSLISELTNGSINPKQFDRILAKYSGIKKRGYTVKKGDSWESIAKQHNTTPEYLKAQNKEGLKEGERIYIDQEYGFIDNAREFYTETLEEFKENNPVDFKLNEIALKEALQDLILIKLAKAKAANIYSTLSSNKKTKEFVDLLTQLNKGRIEQLENLVEEENEEKITKSRGENAVKKVQLDTSNTQKGNPIVTGKVNEEVEKIINDIEQLRKTGEDITIDYIIDQLHKSPGFTVQIIDSLGENSLGVLNSVDIDNLISSQEHPMFVARIKNAFNKLIDQYSTINQEKGSRNKQHQHVPTVDSAQNLSSKYAHLSPKNKDAKEYEKLPVTPVSMILSTFHKKLEKKGGKWVPIPTDKGYLDSTIDQGINLDLIIKPDFLNNQELQSENIQVNFKYSETDKYAEDDPYQRVIDVLHKGEKIGELPGWVDGRPEHLKVLREVIASEAAQEAVGEELGDAYAGYEATILSKKETISKEEYEHFVDTGEVSDDIIDLLAEKYKEGKQDTFTLQERAIFDDKIKEINERLEQMAKLEKVPAVISSTIYELDPDITEEKIKSIYDNYVGLMNRARVGKAVDFNTFKSLLDVYQVFNYGDTYIFGQYDLTTGTFITRMNSAPDSKTLLAEAIPAIAESNLDIISFVPKDYADKLKRSGYTISKQGFDYNFKGEKMVKYAAASNPQIFEKLFGKSAKEVEPRIIEEFGESVKLKYNAVEIDSSDIEQAGTEAVEILEKYLNKFGIAVKDINEIKEKLNIDEAGFADIISKIAYIENKKDLPPVAGEFIAYMMQYNPLVKDIIKELSGVEKDSDYKKLDKTKYFKLVGELIADDFQNKLEGKYNQSLIDKIKELIKRFLDALKNTPVDLINENIGTITNNILKQNKKLITASLYKPGAFGDPTSLVTVEEALKRDSFGKSIIDTMNAQGMILTGSTALSEQGTILRPDENPLHDIDFVSPFSRIETQKRFKEKYPDAIKVRFIEGDGYTTDTYLIAPEGHDISNYITETYIAEDGSERILIKSYDVINSKTGKKAGSFKLEAQEQKKKDGTPILNEDGSVQTKNIEISKGVEGKVIDFFSYDNYEDKNKNEVFSYVGPEGNELKLSNWKDIFKAKLDFARYKDIWDYNRFIPIENVKAISEAQKTTPETEVEQSAREKMIEFNFDYIIKQLENNPITQGDEFLGKKKCD